MAKLIVLFYALLVTFNIAADNSKTSATSKINWLTSYEDAVNQSNTSSKPILLFFTGSDWCSWCHKLEAEVLNTQEFADAASDKFIFVTLDFPMSTKLSANLSAQNKQLQKKYDVRGFPTIVLVDSKGQKIGVTGYRAGGGKQYAEHLFKMLSDFSGYQQKLSQIEKQNFSGQELKHLYEKAQEFGLIQDTNKIINVGFDSDQKPFFLLERYRFLASEGKNDSVEALNLKKQLIASDPANENLTHYQLAIIDFETLAAVGASQKKSADFFISPLVDYIEKFGAEDKANLWRLHMIISQVYYDKNKQEEALIHAKSALTSAPTFVQPEITIVINNIQQTASN
jgi:protein disulfide-isomerase